MVYSSLFFGLNLKITFMPGDASDLFYIVVE